MMMTADGMHLAFSGRHQKLVMFDLYGVDTEIAEVHADIAQSFLSLLYLCYLKIHQSCSVFGIIYACFWSL